MAKIRLATVWLSGCSGCHMSFLDLDEKIIDLAEHLELVYSPLVDHKDFPEQGVDVTLIEGAVANEEHYELVRLIREKSQIVISLGDCAVTGNVPGMRNSIPPRRVLEGVYGKERTLTGTLPQRVVPSLLTRVRPVHEVIPVDLFLHGCPPPAERIGKALAALIAGTKPQFTDKDWKFG